MTATVPTVGDVARLLDQWFPAELAESWDNVGLLLGRAAQPVRRVLVCLTTTPDVVHQAVEEQADMIVSHHPVLFRPVQRLTDGDPASAVVLDLLRHGVALYSPHTAFDGAAGGINQLLAEGLGLQDIRPLDPAEAEQQYKIVVFVPESDLDRVMDAMFDAGAGIIGEYRECSFRVAGKGTFFGTESTSPTVGQKGRREHVDEWRLEVLCPAGRVDAVLEAMVKAHSYEEPAYDVYPLRGGRDSSAGRGRLGVLPEALRLDEFAARCAQLLGAETVGVVGDTDQVVQAVAIACGAGGSFIPMAHAAGADALVTGEARFHEQLDARARGLAVVLAGHFETERYGVERLAARLQEALPSVEVRAARELSPVRYLRP